MQSERLRAFHPTMRKSLDWEAEYGKVDDQVSVQVHIQLPGVSSGEWSFRDA